MSNKHTIVVQEWEESEAGWGVRPDGASLHLNEPDRAVFCKGFWDNVKKANPSGAVPHEYTRESGPPTTMTVSQEVIDKVAATKNGLFLFQFQYGNLCNKGELPK
jgi:hypothetical protein